MVTGLAKPVIRTKQEEGAPRQSEGPIAVCSRHLHKDFHIFEIVVKKRVRSLKVLTALAPFGGTFLFGHTQILDLQLSHSHDLLLLQVAALLIGG